MKAKTIEDAQNIAKNYFEEYKKKHNYSSLESALDMDNTSLSYIFEYLSYLKQNNISKFSDELKKYKFFLDEDSCDKLGTQYINHKDDILNLINALQNIDCDKLDITQLQNALKDILQKFYPKDDKEIIDQKSEKRINNLPLNNIENDVILFLTIKIVFGRHLYIFAYFEFNEDDNDEKKSEIHHIKTSISYLKIYSEILKYHIMNNNKLLLFNLVNILDLDDFSFGENHIPSRLHFFLKDLKVDDNRIKNLAGSLYSNLLGENNNIVKNINLNEYKELFFETLENILNSKCIRQLVQKLKERHKDTNDVITSDNNYINYINYIKKNIIFFPFFNKNAFGLTITLNGKLIINDEFRNIQLRNEQVNLYNFCVWIVTGIHEAIGHFLKDYFYYLTRFVISEDSDDNSSGKAEDGDFIESILFPNAGFYYCDVFYILDINNWNKNLNEFTSYFTSEKRNQIIENGFKSKDLSNFSKEFNELLSKFNIEKILLIGHPAKAKISLKKIDSQVVLDFSERICVTKLKKNKKYFN